MYSGFARRRLRSSGFIFLMSARIFSSSSVMSPSVSAEAALSCSPAFASRPSRSDFSTPDSSSWRIARTDGFSEIDWNSALRRCSMIFFCGSVAGLSPQTSCVIARRRCFA